MQGVPFPEERRKEMADRLYQLVTNGMSQRKAAILLADEYGTSRATVLRHARRFYSLAQLTSDEMRKRTERSRAVARSFDQERQRGMVVAQLAALERIQRAELRTKDGPQLERLSIMSTILGRLIVADTRLDMRGVGQIAEVIEQASETGGADERGERIDSTLSLIQKLRERVSA